MKLIGYQFQFKITTIFDGMAEHNELGKKGEELAVGFLKKKGFKILDQNYRFKHLEVDVIAMDGEELVIVEVKTRNSDFMAGPEITVNKTKQNSMVKVANAYIEEQDLDVETRFDIVSIILNEKQCEIDHIEDAFYPTL